VLTGKETINYNGSQVAGMIAEFLDMPFVSLASKLDINGTTAKMEQEVAGGIQTVEATLPLVVSCAKGMAEQRIPNMRGIMAARTKPLTVITPNAIADLTSYSEYALPPAKSAVKLIDPNNMDELVALLHNEAKVI
jgi:electron transfer flavoprotein beta subunit